MHLENKVYNELPSNMFANYIVISASHPTSVGLGWAFSLRELNQSTTHIDYVKLYLTDNQGQTHECPLKKATHSQQGNVKRQLQSDDDTRVKLAPTQTINLKFKAPQTENIAYFTFEIQGYESS